MSAQAVLRVVFADTHPLTRVSMAYFLDVMPDLQLVAAASSGDDALRLVAQLHPDVVLMDVHLPGMNGIAATRQITTRFPCVRVIALTSYDDSALVRRTLRAGATSYILKSVSPLELADAIRATQMGQAVLSPEIQHVELESIAAEPAIGDNRSSREREVLRFLGSRLTAAARARRRSTRPPPHQTFDGSSRVAQGTLHT